MAMEQAENVAARHAFWAGTELRNDRVADRRAGGLVENEAHAAFGKLPQGDGRFQVRGPDDAALIEQRIDRSQARNVPLGAAGEGAEDSGRFVGELIVELLPYRLSVRRQVDLVDASGKLRRGGERVIKGGWTRPG